jgi:hypothetical protein
MRWSIICEAELGVRELCFRGTVVPFEGFRADDFATALRGLTAFAAIRVRGPRCADFARCGDLAATFFAFFTDFVDVLPAIVFTPGLW